MVVEKRDLWFFIRLSLNFEETFSLVLSWKFYYKSWFKSAKSVKRLSFWKLTFLFYLKRIVHEMEMGEN